MSTIKMQESTFSEEVVQLRKQAANQGNRYATLENELLKKNNDLKAVKDMLSETLSKLREEADHVLKLESDLSRRAEDLRSERLNRQNLEASLAAASEKLASEEQTAKYLQMELDSYASRMSSHHEHELKHLQHEKSTLEARVRALESQSQTNKPSQPPTRLPRPTTLSGVASTVLEARIVTLESDLSKARSELADASRSLAVVQQEATKVPRLQSELIAADNARLRAEKVANAEKASAKDAHELLKEREEELEYWRNTAGDRSVDETRLEDALKERDGAMRSEEGARMRENVFRKRIEELEESEAELVMGREEALNALHRLQAESPAESRADDSTIVELRSTLAERESALLNARGYAAELQQMYRDTLSACEDAEARVRDLEHQLQPAKRDPPPLVIISPPPSPSPPAPFLAQPTPMTRMSADDEAVVVRLLSAIERLRGERDALRRDLHFAKVEHRMADDVLRDRLDATEREVRRLEKVVSTPQEISAEDTNELCRLRDELNAWREKSERTDAELTECNTELANNNTEMDIIRVHVQEVEESRSRLIASNKESSRIAMSSLIVIQHLGSELDQAEDHLAESNWTSNDASINQTFRAELAASNARLSEAIQEVDRRDMQIADMHSQLSGFHIQTTGLEHDLTEAREELIAAETRYSTQQLSVLSSDDRGPADALKSQLDILEQRILRRTEQIGMLQHDTKRLETNLRVAEETIGELTAELEMLGQERTCLVDDCAQAREARDEAYRRVEHLELELESIMNHHNELEETKVALQDAQAEVVTTATSLETMIHVFTESVAKSRGLRSALTRTQVRLTTTEANIILVEDRHSRALTEIEQLSSEVEESQKQYISFQAEHVNVVQNLTWKLEDAKSHLAKAAHDGAASRESLEIDLRRLESEHADELLVLRSQLDESIGQADSLRAHVQTATETIEDLESEIEVSAERYDAAQVKVHNLEEALAAARTHVDEHDASIQALQREKTALQIELTQLEAERDRLATKHQYVEQQAKRSDHELMRLKPELERLQREVAKSDEAAQTAEINLSSKTNQYEQKLAMMQRELQKQQSHHQCQESIAELNEKNEYLEEMLRMRSVEIEENDDRFIDALKEKKRLASKVDSLTRKVQSLQTKIAALAAVPTVAPPLTSTLPLPVARPKTPSPPMPSAGPSTQAPTRIPSSPAVTLRSKTPDPSRRTFGSRIATPEPHVPPLPNIIYKTPDQSRPASRIDTHRSVLIASSFSHVKPASPTPLSSGSRKRRAPDDFDSPVPGPAEAIVAPIGNTTPRHIRHLSSDGRSGFTPTRSNAAVSHPPMLQQPSPLKRGTVPLAESTNSPRGGNKPVGLGKPASVSKPPMRSWLSRSRAPSTVSTETRSISVLGVRP